MTPTVPTLDIAQAEIRIRAEIARMRDTVSVVATARAVLAKFDGKQVSKRMATALQESLPEYRVHYSTDSDYRRDVTIWANSRDGALPYDQRITLTLSRRGLSSSAPWPEFSLDRATRPHLDHGARYPDGAYGGDWQPYMRYEEIIPQAESILANLAELARRYAETGLAYSEAVRAFAPIGWAVFPSR